MFLIKNIDFSSNPFRYSIFVIQKFRRKGEKILETILAAPQQFHVISLLITSVRKEYELKDAHILIHVPPSGSVEPQKELYSSVTHPA